MFNWQLTGVFILLATSVTGCM